MRVHEREKERDGMSFEREGSYPTSPLFSNPEGLADSSLQHGHRKSVGERAKLIAQAFMKEKALIYSKSFTSPLWMWSDERSGAREPREQGGVWWWGQG